MVVCPACKGRKQSMCFVEYVNPRNSGIELVTCERCKGTGEITEEQMAAIERGERIRKARLARHESQREAAAMLNMDFIAYNHLENGID